MEIIQPAEISGKIMTLIDQAQEKLIIVSPYNKIQYWKKLTQRLKKAKQRDVLIKWYIRKNVENNVEQIREIGINPIEIENLHCKMYLNEKGAVVTSMNLHEFSDTSSIDIGYSITEQDRIEELINFINIYIDNNKNNNNLLKKSISLSSIKETSFINLLLEFLTNAGFNQDSIKIHNNGFGKVFTISEFKEHFILIFEPKGNYYRIDLRINYPYKIKTAVYDLLLVKKSEMDSQIGFEIDFGSQMKRLKLDLKVFEHYNYDEWAYREFLVFKPILERVFKTYDKYINFAVNIICSPLSS